jgi:type I pantothenate kinase
VLQTAAGPSRLASDFFDFSVYIDADEQDIAAWYVERFLTLQRTAFQNPASYFHHHRNLPAAEITAVAQRIWQQTNLANLRANILPTRERARVVLRKTRDHSIGEVWLRRM